MTAQDVAAAQGALAAEHAAIYAYGVLGAHVDGAAEASATACWTVHKARRDALIAVIDGLGAEPVAAEPAYALPVRPDTPQAAARLAAQVEGNVVAAYVPLAGASAAALRTRAAQAMQDSALRQVRWGGALPAAAFPGLSAAQVTPR